MGGGNYKGEGYSLTETIFHFVNKFCGIYV